MKISYLIACTVLFSICFGCNGAVKNEMKASEIIKLVKKGKPVQIVNKIIFGDLDFTTAGNPFIKNANVYQNEIQSNIYFDGCTFMGKVTTSGKRGKAVVQSCFNNNLGFVGCDFRGEVDFDGAVVFGTVNFGRSIFREKASFSNMAVWAKESFFSEMKAEKDFLMVYTSFLGNLSFSNAVFDGNASFQETSVKGKLIFNNCAFAGRAGFDLIEVYGSAFFNYATFAKMADFLQSRFLSVANFVKTTFGEQANFEKATFFDSVNFEAVDPSYLNLTDARFVFGNK